MNQIIRFFLNPVIPEAKEHNFKKSVVIFLKTAIFYFAFAFLCGFFILTIDMLLKHAFHIESPLEKGRSIFKSVQHKYGIYSFLIIAVAGPILEELMFRLYLVLRRCFIAVSFGLFTYALSGPIWSFGQHDSLIGYRVGLSLVVFLALLFLPAGIIEKLRTKYFKYVFYFSVLSFGLVHISNFRPINFSIFYIYPFFVLPQLGMGVLLGYLRLNLKYGLFWAMLLHMFINAVGFLLSVTG